MTPKEPTINPRSIKVHPRELTQWEIDAYPVIMEMENRAQDASEEELAIKLKKYFESRNIEKEREEY